MTKIKFISAASLALLLMTGCTANQPSFDPSNTVVEVVDGKSYNIPQGAHPSPYVDAKVIAFYQKIGLTECKEGDITWEEEKAKEEMNVAISKGDKSVYKKLAKEGRIGCASPIAAK
jgi:PBP1b-binding outer membrane lipoprotein LpoB